MNDLLSAVSIGRSVQSQKFLTPELKGWAIHTVNTCPLPGMGALGESFIERVVPLEQHVRTSPLTLPLQPSLNHH